MGSDIKQFPGFQRGQNSALAWVYAQGQQAQMLRSVARGGPAPCLWQLTFIQQEPAWSWARATCHAGCQVRTAVLCSVFLHSSDRSCTSSAPPYPCNKTFQGPLHKTCWIFREVLCSRCRKEIWNSGVSVHWLLILKKPPGTLFTHTVQEKSS